MIALPSINAGIVSYVFPQLDSDANTYITAVESVDGQRLESQIRIGISNFVKGCKDDGTWNFIDSCAFLSIARTLNGSLIKLKGSTPTNTNFVSSDYNRKNGLKGDGSTKYINTNQLSFSPSTLNDFSMGVYVTQVGTAGQRCLIGYGGPSNSVAQITPQLSYISSRCRSSTLSPSNGIIAAPGFYGISRGASANYQYDYFGNVGTVTIASVNLPVNENINIFNRNIANPLFSSDTISFYWIGRNINLALLRTRVDALITQIQGFLP